MRIGVPAASLRDLTESSEVALSLEGALFCDGSECGAPVFLEDGVMELLPPHWHMAVCGKSPAAGPRIYPIWGE